MSDMTAAELQGKTIRIKNTGLQAVYRTMPTDVETGKLIPNIKRIRLDLDVDRNGHSHITAVVYLYPIDGIPEAATLENPHLLLDVEAKEVHDE